MAKKKDPSQTTVPTVTIQSTAVLDTNSQEQYKKPPGVTSSRSCHDIFFVILFIAFWIGMLVITVLAFKNGNFNRLIYGIDSYGIQCGSYNPPIDNVPAFNATELPYLHYLNPLATNPTKVCVKSCPKQNDMICVYGATLSTNPITLQQQLTNGTCFPTLADTQIVMYRCIPVNTISMVANSTLNQNTTSSRVANVIATDLNAADMAAKISQTLADSWQVILGMSGVAVVISFVWLFLLNLFASIIVWMTVILANLATGGLTAYVWYNWNAVRTGGKLILTGSTQVDTQLYNERTLIIIGSISAAIFLIILFISIAARKRIKLATVIIKETSKATRSMPMIFFFPVFKYFILGGLFALFVSVFALLSTSGQVISQTATTQLTTQLSTHVSGHPEVVRSVTPDRVLQFMEIYYVFGFLWTWAFTLGIWQCTIAGAIASWYWCRDKSQLPRMPVMNALWRCFRYHLGSIALGAFLIAVVQLIRLVLFEAQRRLKKTGNKTAQYILSCLQCCFWCLEKFLKFINKNAYIEIAVYGYGFCEAARTAFQLLFRNAFRVVVVDKISNFLLFMGKLFITAVTSLIALYILTTRYTNLGGYYSVPLIFIILISWLIAATFASVVDMGIDTLFLCFCEDCERHDGSAQNPYYMSKELKEFTDKHKGQVPDIAI